MKLITELVIANRILANEDVVDAYGHVSVRNPEAPGRFFLAHSKSPALIEPGDILEFNLDAEPEKIRERYPQVLAVTGPQQYESVVQAVHAAVPPAHDPFIDLVPPEGIKLTPRHYAYVKISEGCNNRCTFCIIPKLRGDLVSRPAADVLREAERLVAAGVKELLVISQDTSAYGLDLKYAQSAWKGREVRAKFIDLRSEASRSQTFGDTIELAAKLGQIVHVLPC